MPQTCYRVRFLGGPRDGGEEKWHFDLDRPTDIIVDGEPPAPSSFDVLDPQAPSPIRRHLYKPAYMLGFLLYYRYCGVCR